MRDNPTPVLSVIVPAYQEAATIGEAMERILRARVSGVAIEVVVVESNSTDGTRDVVSSYQSHDRVTVLYQDSPQGKGSAVRLGLRHARGDMILLQDADLEYDVADYEKLVGPILRGEVAFVLGSRHVDGQPMRQMDHERLASLITNVGHFFFLRVFNLAFRCALTDPFTMYKVFRSDCISGVRFECDRFDFDWELTGKLIRLGYSPMEIPVSYKSRGFKDGKKVRLFRDPITWVHAAVKFSSCSLKSFSDGSHPKPNGSLPA
jgi:glycosyltransferase involved in cell wall biosynthesis